MVPLAALSTTLGSVVAGALADKYLRFKFKVLLLLVLALATAALTIWSLSFPTMLMLKERALMELPKWAIMLLINLVGFVIGSSVPLYYELIIEVTYPVRPPLPDPYSDPNPNHTL